MLTARDARRFVVGLVSAAVAWFLVVYPNFSALPLPTVVANAFQGVLPTYLYPFQFPTNRTAVVKDVQLLDPIALVIAGSLVLLCIVIAYSAWVWRIAIAERRAAEADAAAGGVMTWVAAAADRGRGVPWLRRAWSSRALPARRRCRSCASGVSSATAGPPRSASPAARRARGDGGIGAWKPGGSAPRAASRRITTP